MTLEAIKGECMRKMMTAMATTLTDCDAMAKDAVASYYTGSPIKYVRTGTLTTSPKSEGVFGGGDSCHINVYMDPGISYNTGTFSGMQVIDATNTGTAGVVGTPGYWERIEENSKIIADAHFGAVFG